MENKNKYPLINKSGFDAFCIAMSIPLNAIIAILASFITVGLLLNKDWNFSWSLVVVIYSATNLKSILSLMDYPDE